MKYTFEVIGMGAKKYGGFERYIVEEAQQLKAKGCGLVVIFDREPLATNYISDLHSLGAITEVIPQETLFAFARAFNLLLKKYKPYAVHTNFSSNLFPALFLARLHGVQRRIATEHCLPCIKTLHNKISYQLAVALADEVLPVSKKSAEALAAGVHFGKHKIHTLYLGIQEFLYDKHQNRLELGIPDDTISIMNVAYHDPVKGVDILLRAMDILINTKKIRNIRLFQIGGGMTGANTDNLHQLAKDLKIDDYIEWMGIRNDVPRLLCAGDIYCQPSRSEGIPLSIMEASMAQLPTVATNVGGNPEAAIQGENAILVPAEDPDRLASALLEMINNYDMRTSYGKEGRKIAMESFNLSSQVSQLIAKYYRL